MLLCGNEFGNRGSLKRGHDLTGDLFAYMNNL